MVKIIHYCWFGGQDIPEKLQQCIRTWQKMMPDWELRKWDETNFDVNSIAWTKCAYEAKKYAFVSDYVRLHALFHEGGIYLDTDVKLMKSLEPLVERSQAFGGFECNEYLTSAVIAAPPNHVLIKLFMDHYKNKIFNDHIVNSNEANVRMMTDICKNHGLITDDSEQRIKIPDSGTLNNCDFIVYPQTYFCPLDFWHNKNFSKNTHAVHLFDASWLNEETKKRIELERSVLFKYLSIVKSKINSIIKSFK